MMQLRLLAIPFLALTLAASCGKKTPEGTTPPGETGGASGSESGGGGSGGGSEGGGSEGGSEGGSDGGGGGPALADNGLPEGCTPDSEVSGTPTALFADKLIIRLPKNVELVEKTPFLFFANKAISKCDFQVTMFVGYFQYDPARPIKQVRDDTLGQFGFAASEIQGWTDETEKGANYTGTFEIGAGPKGEPPAKGIAAFKEAEGIHYYAIYTVHPDGWKALSATFQESAKRILILRKK